MNQLQKHLRTRKVVKGQHCDSQFCKEIHHQQHLRTIQETPKDHQDINQPIYPENQEYQDYPAFKTLVEEKKRLIEDHERSYAHNRIINIKIR